MGAPSLDLVAWLLELGAAPDGLGVREENGLYKSPTPLSTVAFGLQTKVTYARMYGFGVLSPQDEAAAREPVVAAGLALVAAGADVNAVTVTNPCGNPLRQSPVVGAIGAGATALLPAFAAAGLSAEEASVGLIALGGSFFAASEEEIAAVVAQARARSGGRGRSALGTVRMGSLRGPGAMTAPCAPQLVAAGGSLNGLPGLSLNGAETPLESGGRASLAAASCDYGQQFHLLTPPPMRFVPALMTAVMKPELGLPRLRALLSAGADIVIGPRPDSWRRVPATLRGRHSAALASVLEMPAMGPGREDAVEALLSSPAGRSLTMEEVGPPAGFFWGSGSRCCWPKLPPSAIALLRWLRMWPALAAGRSCRPGWGEARL